MSDKVIDKAYRLVDSGAVGAPAGVARTFLVWSEGRQNPYVVAYCLPTEKAKDPQDQDFRFWRCDCRYGQVHLARKVEHETEPDGAPCSHVWAGVIRFEQTGSPL